MTLFSLLLSRLPSSVRVAGTVKVRRWESVCACTAALSPLPDTGARCSHAVTLSTWDQRPPAKGWLGSTVYGERHAGVRKLFHNQVSCCLLHRELHLTPHPGYARPVPQEKRCPESAEGKDPASTRLSELYENPWTIPNFLSMTRIGLAPVLGYLIVGENFNIALGVFVFAGITDLLDGYIARNWANQKSALGSALDPLADKILVSVLYVCLTLANLIPVPLTSMIILRDIALIAAVFYVRYKTLPPPRTVSKYFNPCYVTAQLEPTFISKMNTAVQLVLVAASLAAPVFNFVDSIYLQTLWCITAFTTAASAHSYYRYGRQTVKILNK
ncbi:cardiolipin synthase (CMP-forming) [Bombina bombina]|uniref:cardiolipin synthase (CMP-forming) n=1 Tax=Bombina bombina TaxID=8345 RepID=UPI00235AFFDD|nr:cardiolipin synthase (CMP-forming) [Bombina bombina]